MVKVMRMMMIKMVPSWVQGGEEEEGADQRFTFKFSVWWAGEVPSSLAALWENFSSLTRPAQSAQSSPGLPRRRGWPI